MMTATPVPEMITCGASFLMSRPMHPPPAVAISHLSKYFPLITLRRLLAGRRGQGVWALQDINLEL